MVSQCSLSSLVLAVLLQYCSHSVLLPSAIVLVLWTGKLHHPLGMETTPLTACIVHTLGLCLYCNLWDHGDGPLWDLRACSHKYVATEVSQNAWLHKLSSSCTICSSSLALPDYSKIVSCPQHEEVRWDPVKESLSSLEGNCQAWTYCL